MKQGPLVLRYRRYGEPKAGKAHPKKMYAPERSICAGWIFDQTEFIMGCVFFFVDTSKLGVGRK